jgi:Mg-chelatase subunit ChlI
MQPAEMVVVGLLESATQGRDQASRSGLAFQWLACSIVNLTLNPSDSLS